MIFNNYTVNSLPVVVIDNFYDNDAVDRIMQEISFYSTRDKWLSPDQTGSASFVGDDGLKHWSKQNKGLYLDKIYHDRSVSDILFENRKFFNPTITNKLIEINPLFRYLKHANADCTLLSYYEDNDYYLPHVDDSAMTILTWFYQQPKRFNGGNFKIENELTIECQFNRAVVFPSILYHAVDAISIEPEYKNKMLGRYTLTQLVTYKL